MKNSVPIAEHQPPAALSQTRRARRTRSAERLAAKQALWEEEIDGLIDASFQLIRETGALEPRVGEIVARAGLSNQTFYRHFRSKDELLLAVLERGIEMLGETLSRRMARQKTPLDELRAWVRGIAAQALDPAAAEATRPFALSRARLSELFPAEVEASEARLTAMASHAIARAQDDGSLEAADPPRDADTLYALAMGFVQRSLAKQGPASRADADHLVAFAMAGLNRGKDR